MLDSDKAEQPRVEGKKPAGDLDEVISKVKGLEQFKWAIITVVVVITAVGSFGIWRLFDWADGEIKRIISEEKVKTIDKAMKEADEILARMRANESDQVNLSLSKLNASLLELKESIPILRVEQGFHNANTPNDYEPDAQLMGQFRYRSHVSFEQPFTEPPIVFVSLSRVLQKTWPINQLAVAYDIGLENVDTHGFDYTAICGDLRYWSRRQVAWIAFGK